MMRPDEEYLSRVMVEAIGGREPWMVLWSNNEHPDGGIISSVQPDDVAQLLCIYLLKVLRGEVGAAQTTAQEH